MIYDLPWYTIILTFINVIDSRLTLNIYLFIYLFVLIYIAHPWYPGGHVLSKMQGWHLYLQDRHGEGSQKKKHKQKIPKTATQSESVARKTGTEGELQELKKKKKKKTSPAHPCHRPLPDSKNSQKEGQTYQTPRQRRKRSQKGKKIGPQDPKTPLKVGVDYNRWVIFCIILGTVFLYSIQPISAWNDKIFGIGAKKKVCILKTGRVN